MNKNDNKKSIDELFKEVYSEQLADLLDETNITLIDEHSPPNKETNLVQGAIGPSLDSKPDAAKNDIVISDIELSPTMLKIGKVEFKGKITKYALGAVIALIVIGWFFS